MNNENVPTENVNSTDDEARLPKSVLLVLLVAALIAGSLFAGYKTGYKKGQDSADQTPVSVQQTQIPLDTNNKLPAVTPLETLRNFLGNFYFDANIIKGGYKDSPSITKKLVDKVAENERRQISVVKSFFCSDTLPSTVSFNAQAIADGSTTANVGTEETFQDDTTLKPSYSFVLVDDRWKVDSVSCPS